jgi:histidinol-phosphate/aromatic aminotransferase/cobyric acid decarboxylase-like protein
MEDIYEKAIPCDTVVFVNPNNPTGTICRSCEIYSFALSNTDKKVIVDESFIEFSSEPSIINLLEKDPVDNIIVVKSLSKSLGVPGIRLGYTYSCSKEYNQYVKSTLPIWNMNSTAEFFLEILLKHRNSLKASFRQTIIDRDDFIKKLKRLSFVDKVFDSEANFILVRFVHSSLFAAELSNRLLAERQVFVKDISRKFPDGKGYIRLAVRTAEENYGLVKLLDEHGNSGKRGKL